MFKWAKLVPFCIVNTSNSLYDSQDLFANLLYQFDLFEFVGMTLKTF